MLLNITKNVIPKNIVTQFGFIWCFLGITFRFGIFGKFVNRNDVPFSLHHSRRHMMLIHLILMTLTSRHISTMCLLLCCSKKGPICSFLLHWLDVDAQHDLGIYLRKIQKNLLPGSLIDCMGQNLFHLHPGTWSCLGLFIVRKIEFYCAWAIVHWILLQSC